MITFLIFVLPCIKLLMGEKHNLEFESAISESELKKRKGRAEFQRGIIYKKIIKKLCKDCWRARLGNTKFNDKSKLFNLSACRTRKS